ncbi:MAG: hypothetical protein ACOH14_11035 [Rhodoglobus sp.]
MTEHAPDSAEHSNLEPLDSQASDSAVLEQHDPAALSPPDLPPAARRRWPWWAWALLFGVPLMAIPGIVAGLVVNELAGQAARAIICYADGYCGFGTSPESFSRATGDPVDAAGPTNRVTLDGNAVFDGQPVWSFTLEPSWHALTFDQDGINVFQDEATGCQLITSQSLALPDPDAVSDIEVSYSLLSREIAGFTGNDPGALILNRGTTDIPIAVVGSDSTLEFASATIDQSNPEGVSKSTEIAVRSMPDSKSELVAALTCDTAAFEAFGAKFELFSKALAVSVSP